MIIALILYIIGFVCMGAVCFFLTCLGGKTPTAVEFFVGILAMVFWPLVLPWFSWKVVRPLMKFKIWR